MLLARTHRHAAACPAAPARFRRPDAELQLPDTFVPILEETGLIIEAGDWVLRSAVQTLRERALNLAINISPRQLQHPTSPTG